MAYALVSSVLVAQSANGATSSAINTTGASLLIFHVANYIGGSYSVSDSKGNTYSALTDYTAGNGRSRIFYCANPSVGTGHTFTVSGTNVYFTAEAAAFSGALTVSPFGTENGNSNTGTTVQAGSVTPSEDGMLIIAGLCSTDGTSGTNSINQSFTIAQQGAFDTFWEGGSLAYLIQTTAAAVNPTWTIGGGSGGLVAAIATFKAAAGSSGAITASNTLGAATSSATVKGRAGITSAPTLGALTSTATVGAPRNVSAAQTLGQLGSVANLILIDPALANNTLGQMTSSAQVKVFASITSTPTLGALTSVAGINVNTVSATQTLGSLTSSAALKGVAGITSAKTLGDATAAAFIAPNSVITGSSILDAMVSSAVVAHGHVMRPSWTRRTSNATTWTRRA